MCLCVWLLGVGYKDRDVCGMTIFFCVSFVVYEISGFSFSFLLFLSSLFYLMTERNVGTGLPPFFSLLARF